MYIFVRKIFSWKIGNRDSRNKFATGPRKAPGGPDIKFYMNNINANNFLHLYV
jgi:hypothetical protein